MARTKTREHETERTASKDESKTSQRDDSLDNGVPLEEASKIAKESAVEDEMVDVGTRKVSAEAVDATLVQGVGAGIGLTPGTDVSVTLQNGRVVSARVMAVHPGSPANEAIGLTEAIPPSIDVKAFTGNPNTGGYEVLTGLPVSSVVAEAQFGASAKAEK